MISAIIDCETTGLTLPSVSELHKQPRVIEFACARIEDGRVVAEHEWLIWPGEDITAEITKITGITNDMLAGKPRFEEAAEEIAASMRFADQLIAHNAPFDVACLSYELQRCGYEDFPWPTETLCSVQEFVHEFGRRPKLTELYERKLGKPLAQTHRALDDVRALVEILVKEGLV